MQETKVICPVCGAEVVIGEHEHQVKNATVIGKDSGLGTVVLNVKQTKAEMRLEAMKKAGIDISKFFAMRGSNGDDILLKQGEDGKFERIEDDPIIEKIMACGSLRNSHLFKQHVLAQLFNSMCRYNYRTREMSRDNNGDIIFGNLTKYMYYDYQWKCLRDRLKEQKAMYLHGDVDTYNKDNMWYNKELALGMFDDYMSQLREIISMKRVHKCKGREYIRLKCSSSLFRTRKQSSYGYVYKSEVLSMMDALYGLEQSIVSATNPAQLYNAVKRFCERRPMLQPTDLKCGYKYEVKLCKAFVNAYKGFGGYWGLRNLIMFHGCIIKDTQRYDNKLHKVVYENPLSKEESLAKIDEWANSHRTEGYYMLGAFKEVVKYNNFDVTAKTREWRDKYVK